MPIVHTHHKKSLLLLQLIFDCVWTGKVVWKSKETLSKSKLFKLSSNVLYDDFRWLFTLFEQGSAVWTEHCTSRVKSCLLSQVACSNLKRHKFTGVWTNCNRTRMLCDIFILNVLFVCFFFLSFFHQLINS